MSPMDPHKKSRSSQCSAAGFDSAQRKSRIIAALKMKGWDYTPADIATQCRYSRGQYYRILKTGGGPRCCFWKRLAGALGDEGWADYLRTGTGPKPQYVKSAYSSQIIAADNYDYEHGIGFSRPESPFKQGTWSVGINEGTGARFVGGRRYDPGNPTARLVLLHGLGLSHDDFTPFFNLAGPASIWAPHIRIEPGDDIHTHARIARDIIVQAGTDFAAPLIIVGFSLGADLLTCLNPGLQGQNIAHVVLLDMNIDISTCFFSSSFASLTLPDVDGATTQHAVRHMILSRLLEMVFKPLPERGFEETLGYFATVERNMGFSQQDIAPLTAFAKSLVAYARTPFRERLLRVVEAVSSTRDTLPNVHFLVSLGSLSPLTKELDLKPSLRATATFPDSRSCSVCPSHFGLLNPRHLQDALPNLPWHTYLQFDPA